MRKVVLVLFILVDLAVMAGAGLFLYMRFSHKSLSDLGLNAPPQIADALPKTSSTPPERPAGNSLIATPGVDGSSTAVVSNTPLAGNPGTETGARNIKFAYRNSKAKQVSIRADFTGWKAIAMQKDAAGTWTYAAALVPGEYAYCFTVDDKTFKDPANKRTKQIGRTFVSAILVKPNTAPR